jgi:osmotically-inducible protein OsmY
MTPRTWAYGDVEGEDLPIRDQPYESFGQQGFAMPDHAAQGAVAPHGVARIELGEPALPRSRGPRNWHRRDERIHDDVCRMLTDDGWVDARELEVIVHHGEVTLTGSVPERSQRERAVHIAESVRGVTEVVSRLHVR